MALVSRIYLVNFSTAVLRSAALAIALLVPASPARAEPVTLSCRVEAGQPGPATLTLRINYATGLVEQLAPSGEAYTRVATATISPNAIVWSVKYLDTGLQTPVPTVWEGTIDRLSGIGWEQWSREPYWRPQRTNFTCREATKPKF